MGWEVAVLEQQYREHVDRLGPLPAAAGAVRGDARAAAVSTARGRPSTTTSGRRSATRPGAGMLDLLLVDGDGTATSLGQQLPVTRQAVAKHLGVLDRVGLVRATPAGREKRYRVDDAQLARAVAQLSSVGSAWDARLQRIKRIAEAIQRTQSTDRQTDRRMRGEPRWWTSCTGSGVVTPTPEKVYEALTTVDGLAGWWTEDTTRQPATSAACWSSGSRRSAASTWRSSSSSRRKRVTLAGRRRPRGVGRHDDRLGAAPGRRLHDRAVHARGLAGAGGVHAPLQHEVGLVPDEPEVARGDRRGRTGATGRADQRLALSNRAVSP